jgi:hypothetical protein
MYPFLPGYRAKIRQAQQVTVDSSIEQEEKCVERGFLSSTRLNNTQELLVLKWREGERKDGLRSKVPHDPISTLSLFVENG